MPVSRRFPILTAINNAYPAIYANRIQALNTGFSGKPALCILRSLDDIESGHFAAGSAFVIPKALGQLRNVD